MRSFKKFGTILMILALSVNIGCEKDEDILPDENPPIDYSEDIGEITFTVSGDMNDEFVGKGCYVLKVTSGGQTYYSINTHGDKQDNSHSFSFQFRKMDTVPNEDYILEPGTYTVGSLGSAFGAGGDASDFVSELQIHAEDFTQPNLAEYRTWFHDTSIYDEIGGPNQGTITITSSNASETKGYFEINAYRTSEPDEENFDLDGQIEGAVTILGEFRAIHDTE